MLDDATDHTRIRRILVTIILSTLPCYCLGIIVLTFNSRGSTKPTMTPSQMIETRISPVWISSATMTLPPGTVIGTATRTVTPTITSTPTETLPPTDTLTPFMPATNTQTLQPTATPTLTATASPTETVTITPSVTDTLEPSPTETQTLTVTP
jgi:hypothetical protein